LEAVNRKKSQLPDRKIFLRPALSEEFAPGPSPSLDAQNFLSYRAEGIHDGFPNFLFQSA
jgi:hypothetical protein